MRTLLLCVLLWMGSPALRAASHPWFYQLRIYHCSTTAQMQALETYLKDAYLPALHRAGINLVGVFKPIETSDSAGKMIYVFLPAATLQKLLDIDQSLERDDAYRASGKSFLNAPYDSAPYTRMESILMEAFEDMPSPAQPRLTTAPADRIYELRSYESPTQAYHLNKIHMFNQGGEIPLFQRLRFNAVFYADVLSGAHMPNLMYLTTFNSQVERDQHWTAFFNDPFWKKLVALPEYQHNVSKADIWFLHPTDYSDL
jgi:hypothetical protein